MRGPHGSSHSEPAGGGRLRIPVGGNDPESNAAPRTPAGRDGSGDAQACELPAPTGQGRIYNPPHPLFAIAFIYCVSTALLWGALSAGGDANARLVVAFVGLCVCLVAAVHWVEGVHISHAPAKLGVRPAPARAWWVASAATAPALLWIAGAFFIGAAVPTDGTASPLQAWDWVLRIATLIAAAAWYEGFYRGFVFRSLMRRHGFATSAATSALLLSVATPVVTGAPFLHGRALAGAAVELPLSMALCALFWLHEQSLGPALVVRVVILATTWWTASVWPAVAATALILFFVRSQRWRRSSPPD